MLRAFLSLCLIISILVAVTGAVALASPARWMEQAAILPKISPFLRDQLAAASETTFLVIMKEQADLRHAVTLPTKTAKGHAVFETLREVAQRTQAPVRAVLDARGVEYRAFHIVNMLAVRGSSELALTLAARPDVARLEANPSVRVPLPPAEQPPQSSFLQPAGTEWGVRKINADDVWALGYRGQGIVVAGQDTGYDWDHPALKSQYRGWNGTTVVHDYNWHDAIHANNSSTAPGNVCGFDATAPCDDHGHGTHTIGTAVGSDGGTNEIGVAPGAQWIGCRNMEDGAGTPATYAECFEFFLAPYPVGGDPMADGRPELAPHVISNSWTCPPSEGCSTASLRLIVQNVRAAGISVVVSAGNSGSSCASVVDPPAIHEAAFSIGATDSRNQIASFSSRGPVSTDGSDRPKPDVAAPGVGVRSSFPGGFYTSMSGTSMAAPHVAGLVALLWSADPALIGQVDLTESILRGTALPRLDDQCGGDADLHPNNVYGWGIVDALAAVRSRSQQGLALAAEAQPERVRAGEALTLTLHVTNTSLISPATGLVLSDSLPLSTTFAWASGDYQRANGDVLWQLGTLSPTHVVSASLAVTVEAAVPRGTVIVHADYGVRSSEVPTPVLGAPLRILVPWENFLPALFKRTLE